MKTFTRQKKRGETELFVKRFPLIKLFFISSLLFCLAPLADEADVVDLSIKSVGVSASSGMPQFIIAATVKHNDTGWKHYADAWDVLDENGSVLGTRVLYHPHIAEQPFKRTLILEIPLEVKKVTVKAKDNVHKNSGAEMSIDVPHEQ